jgi:hypothetical protein
MFYFYVNCRTLFSLSDEKDVRLVEENCYICPWKVMETSGFLWLYILGKKDGHLIRSSLPLVCQMLTEKIALMRDVTSCSLVEKY